MAKREHTCILDADLQAALMKIRDSESWLRARMLDLEIENKRLHGGDREHLVRQREFAEETAQLLRDELAALRKAGAA